MEVFLLTKVWVFSENAHNNMVILRFLAAEGSPTEGNEISVMADYKGFLSVRLKCSYDEEQTMSLQLDKPTAVRLQKELRRQISFMGEEANDGN